MRGIYLSYSDYNRNIFDFFPNKMELYAWCVKRARARVSAWVLESDGEKSFLIYLQPCTHARATNGTGIQLITDNEID